MLAAAWICSRSALQSAEESCHAPYWVSSIYHEKSALRVSRILKSFSSGISEAAKKSIGEEFEMLDHLIL